MSSRSIAGSLAALLAAAFLTGASAAQGQAGAATTETRVPVDTASLYARAVGREQPMIVLTVAPTSIPHISWWELPGYDLLPKLRSLRIPTLVIVGEHDFIPTEIGTQIAQALANATLVIPRDCGHFAYLECAAEVRKAIDNFFRR
jgi:pimeloyl-ACP methyl ester carboxylesterase